VKAAKWNAKDETRITAAEMKCMRLAARYNSVDYSGNEDIRKLTKTIFV
jgi:hypothetical protein